MTTETLTAEATFGDVEAAIEAGRQTAQPHLLAPGGFYTVATRHGIQKIDLTDLDRTVPRRLHRRVTVDAVGSFVDYWDKHAGPDSEVWADRRRLAIHAIIDAPGKDVPAWEAHIVQLQLQHSTGWQEWTAADQRFHAQDEFANFIEEHLGDITSPPGAEMLEIAQTLHATTKVAFTSGYRLVDGQRQLSYVEETTGTAGPQGTLQIPTQFTLVLPIFHGTTVGDPLTARLRYRLQGQKLLLGYALDRAVEAVDAAYAAIVDEVQDGIGEEQPIFHGTAA